MCMPRLLADARFLQEKLAGLKNVTAPTAMLETIVSEKPVTPKPSPPRQVQAQQQPPVAAPVIAPATSGGRFKGMLARASTLNGRKASLPAVVANTEKALPPPSAPGLPDIDPMGDNAPSSLPMTGKTVSAPTPTPTPTIALAEKPLVAEPEDAGADGLPPLTPPKAEGPSAKDEDKDKDKVPQQNEAENEKTSKAMANGVTETAAATATLNGKVETDAGADAPASLSAPSASVEEAQSSPESAS